MKMKSFVCMAILLISSCAFAGPLDDLGSFLCYGKAVDWGRVIHANYNSPEFIAAIVDLRNMGDDAGGCESYKLKEGRIELRYREATAVCRLYTADTLLSGIYCDDVKYKNDSLAKIKKHLEAIPFDASVVVKEMGKDKRLLEVNPIKAMAVGSAFKLFILKALVRQIDAEKMTWADVYPLKEEYKSLPSGMMQDWVVNAPATLDTYASLMISISDNTATNALLHILGRENVEKLSLYSHPFLDTNEMFILKYAAPKIIRNDYIKGEISEKEKVLKKLHVYKKKLMSLDEASFLDKPMFIDKIEWFATTSELCDLILSLKDEKHLRINSGILQTGRKWRVIGYKGGSEAGVLNMTYVLKSNSGKWYAVSMTWNDKDNLVSMSRFSSFIYRIVDLLK